MQYLFCLNNRKLCSFVVEILLLMLRKNERNNVSFWYIKFEEKRKRTEKWEIEIDLFIWNLSCALSGWWKKMKAPTRQVWNIFFLSFLKLQYEIRQASNNTNKKPLSLPLPIAINIYIISLPFSSWQETVSLTSTSIGKL